MSDMSNMLAKSNALRQSAKAKDAEVRALTTLIEQKETEGRNELWECCAVTCHDWMFTLFPQSTEHNCDISASGCIIHFCFTVFNTRWIPVVESCIFFCWRLDVRKCTKLFNLLLLQYIYTDSSGGTLLFLLFYSISFGWISSTAAQYLLMGTNVNVPVEDLLDPFWNVWQTIGKLLEIVLCAVNTGLEKF